MTLVLRRKRQTTVWSTRSAKARRSPAIRSDVARGTPPLSGLFFLQSRLASPLAGTLVAVLMASLAVAAETTPAMADDATGQGPAVTAVSYTTGQSGHKLKWLPYRPNKLRATDRVMPAQHLVAATSSTGLRTVQHDAARPIDDPFGDRTTVPPATIDDTSLEPPKAETGPGDAFPSFSVDELAPGELSPAELVPPDGPPADDYLTPADAGRDVPTMDEVLADRSGTLEGKCPRPDEILKPIGKLSSDTTPKDGEFPANCTLGERPYELRSWAPTTFTWKASGLCHKPLYFEDVHLERYGHSWGPYIQPVFSGAHFFLTVPILPYKMGLYPPNECMYTLGYYRPGSCAPYLLDPLPISIRAALAQGGVATGVAYLLP